MVSMCVLCCFLYTKHLDLMFRVLVQLNRTFGPDKSNYHLVSMWVFQSRS